MDMNTAAPMTGKDSLSNEVFVEFDSHLCYLITGCGGKQDLKMLGSTREIIVLVLTPTAIGGTSGVV